MNRPKKGTCSKVKDTVNNRGVALRTQDLPAQPHDTNYPIFKKVYKSSSRHLKELPILPSKATAEAGMEMDLQAMTSWISSYLAAAAGMGEIMLKMR